MRRPQVSALLRSVLNEPQWGSAPRSSSYPLHAQLLSVASWAWVAPDGAQIIREPPASGFFLMIYSAHPKIAIQPAANKFAAFCLGILLLHETGKKILRH